MRASLLLALLALAATASAQPGGACDRTYRPACGIDGKTYNNPCLARVATGVPPASVGPCADDAVKEGGAGDVVAPAVPAAAAAPAAAPVATPVVAATPVTPAAAPAKPPTAAACPLIVKPVCGVDGKTYDNPCLARVAEVSVATVGECGAAAGAKADADGLVGAGPGAPVVAGKPLTAAAEGPPGASDAPVVAAPPPKPAVGAGAAATKPRPLACPLIFKPVCGVDKKTYSNECAARGAQVAVASQGECGSGGPSTDPAALEPESAAAPAAAPAATPTPPSTPPKQPAPPAPRRLPAIEDPTQEPSQGAQP